VIVMAIEGRAPLITLLSDLGTRDTYVGVMKAVIMGLCPEARIVDLCHDIEPQDVQQAAFLLDTAWRYCPEGTVHVIVVDPGVGSDRRVVVLDVHNQHFVAPDNGVLTYVLVGAKDYEAFFVEQSEYLLSDVSRTFHGRDIMAPVAARLASGLPPEAVGRAVEGSLELLPIPRPVAMPAGLESHVIHVDRFGNLVTDLSEADLVTWQRESGARQLLVQVGDSAIEGLSLTYAGAHPGEMLALIGSSGRLEIAVNMGSAAECLGVGRGALVLIEARG
jgi:S-adenosylmethionine hydrolase